MNKVKHLLMYVFVVLFFLSIFAFFTQERYISETTAIEKAKLYCAETHFPPEDEPYNFDTELVQCGQVESQTGWQACDTKLHSSNLMIWYVSMSGLWLHWGPPAEDETNTPIQFTECRVIMDAKTGEMFELGSN